MKNTEEVERQIYEQRKTVRYDIRELTIEVISSKYDDSIDEEGSKDGRFNYIYVPDYQRDFTWDKKRQSRLIESIILGLPIPLIFVAENKDSSWEIVDGSQRIRTMHAFINNHLKLVDLERLTYLNGYHFTDLEPARRGKFLNTAMRMIVLSEETTDQVKKDMFERINRGSDLLKPMEKRKGIYKGAFNTFVYSFCNESTQFRSLAPVDNWLLNRQEHEELLLRFFALSEKGRYAHGLSKKGIAAFLDEYLDSKNKEIEKLSPGEQERVLSEYKKRINSVMAFVSQHFPFGFRRAQNPQTKRSVFEAISVGVYEFLISGKPIATNCSSASIEKALSSDEFRKLTVGAMELHKKAKLKGRVDYIKNMLAG